MTYSLTDAERKLCFYTVDSFIKKNLIKDGYGYHFKCPLCAYYNYNNYFVKRNGEFISNDLWWGNREIHSLEYGLRSHLYRTILFRADEEHIKLLLNLYGKDVGLKILKKLALHSFLIFKKIKRILKKIK